MDILHESHDDIRRGTYKLIKCSHATHISSYESVGLVNWMIQYNGDN